MSTEIPQAKILEKRIAIEKDLTRVQIELKELQEKCTHPNNKTIYRGLVTVTECPDCGLFDEY